MRCRYDRNSFPVDKIKFHCHLLESFSADNVVNRLVDAGHPENVVVVLDFEPDGSIDGPGRHHPLLVLDVPQLLEGGPGKVFKEGEPQPGPLGRTVPRASCIAHLSRRKLLTVAEHQVTPVPRVEARNDGLRAVLLAW